MVAADEFRKPQMPWCTVCLVVSVITSQTAVLVGNFWTATVMAELGQSTNGWSQIGVGIARSLESEMNAKMTNVSMQILDGISHISFVQDALDGVLALVGNTTDDAITTTPELSTGISLLQTGQAPGDTGDAAVKGTLEALTPVIMTAVHSILQKVQAKVSETLQTLLVKIKPALLQVSAWLTQFGSKIQSGVDTFSGSLDAVQSIFDQVMSQMHGSGGNAKEMLDQTYGLFDMTEDGYVEAVDLKQVAILYSIVALQGNLSDMLVAKYDSSGDGKLTKEELGLAVTDAAIPGAMGVILRTYARRLAEVAGAVASARMRDDLSLGVVQYFDLVVAKNMTKVGWVADRLGNQSLPKEFTADVLIQLCLHEDDPNKLTLGSVGKIVVGDMFRLHAKYTLQMLDMLANTSFWDSEGFDVQDQPTCMKRVTGWVTDARKASPKKHKGNATSPKKHKGNATSEAVAPASFIELIGLLDMSSEEAAASAAQEHAILSLMSETAERLAQGSVDLFLLEKTEKERRRHDYYFSSETSQLLLTQLLGGVSVRAATQGSSANHKVGKRGQMAKPETLEFASWLAQNASATAKLRLEMCFNYSSTSTNKMDTFSSKIQGVVSNVQSFLNIMMKYATPAGIDKLESDIQQFVEKGMQDVMVVVEKRIIQTLNASSPELEKAIHKAARRAGEVLGMQLGQTLGSPLGEALGPALKGIVSGMTNGSAAAENLIGASMGDELGQALANMTAGALAKEGGDIMEKLVDQVLAGGSTYAEKMLQDVTGKLSADPLGDSAKSPPALLSAGGFHHRSQGHTVGMRNQVRRAAVNAAGDDVGKILSLVSVSHTGPVDQVVSAMSGVWTTLVNTLKSLMNALPTAVTALKNARKEVSNLQSSLDSIFSTFESKGPQIFDTIAWYYRAIWVGYFVLLFPLNIGILYYGFWSSGYFGGPMPFPKEQEDEAVATRTWRERCYLCAGSSSRWMQNKHDTAACFWSVILFMQIIVLLIFTASVALCIIAGVKALLMAGCQEIYVLSDNLICTETLNNLRSWLGSFVLGDMPLEQVCQDKRLLTCNIIQSKMVASTILTTACSLVATLLSLQMIIDSAVLHERARWRRLATEMYLQEAAASPASASAAAKSSAD